MLEAELGAMEDHDSFDNLMSRLKTGDQGAATEIFDRFARRLVGLARSRLDERMRQKVDPEDVMQSVFKSFFRVHNDGKVDLASWDSMWALLTVITLRKCGHRVEYFRAGRRDVAREVQPRAGSDESVSSFQASRAIRRPRMRPCSKKPWNSCFAAWSPASRKS